MPTKKLQHNKEDTVEVRVRLPKEVNKTLAELANVHNTSFNQIVNLLVNKLLNRKPDILDIIRSSYSVSVLLPNIRKINTAYSHLRLESPSNTDVFMQKGDRFIAEANEFIQQLANTNQGE